MSNVCVSATLRHHNVRIVGQGVDVVVLSHGLGGSQDAWQNLLPHLTPHYRVVLYDLKGHGASAAEQDGDDDMSRYKSMDGFARDLIAILSDLKIRDCLYVGHSMSGVIGCLAATARPDLFSKIVLLGASPRYMNDDGYEGGFQEQQVDNLLAALEQDYASWVKGFAPTALGPDASSESLAQYENFLLLVNPDFMLLIANTVFKSDVRKLLPLVTIPCHVVQTKEDFAVPRAVANYLHRQLRGEIQILDTRGHIPHVTHPEILAPVLRKLFGAEQSVE